MLSVLILIPLAAAGLLAVVRRCPDPVARWAWLAVSALETALVGVVWAGYRPGSGLAYEEQLPWIPGLGVSYHVGVDGLSLPLLALTAIVFLACAIYALRQSDRPRQQAALFLFLQFSCVGLFAAQDLIVFFVFFDLSIVGMYFVIARWGHGDAARSALMFFLYTFLGSLALLLGFIGVYVISSPHTFDIAALTRHPPAGGGIVVGLVLAAILLGLAIKTPTVPFHSWLPPAHTDAPAVGSAVLAGLLLKMGTYGFVRIAMPILPDAWRDWAWPITIVGLVSVLYGALVALAQSDLKRMIAYTSVNHMGYVVLGVGVAGLVAGSDAQARTAAVTGAVTQMVAHGLITSALFLLAGVFRDRAASYDLDDYGGLAQHAPRLTALFSVAAFASLGLPGFAGFIAEFQIFTGSIATAWVTAIALLGILITAGLFLRAVHRIFTGPTVGRSVGFTDLHPSEVVSTGLLLGLAVVIGVAPQLLLGVIQPASAVLIALVGR
jgi:NADH-quinone oxidoreductase subunit M